MSAINKYRVVGPRYKQQTRIYKDEIFHFSSEDGPQNVIITGKNSFGKGVLLQLLFQPIVPKTAWSRGKNKVNHFFYANNGKFKPYTFYSCIDFHLDLNKHLLVGVAMTSQLNEKNDSEPLYTLFVRSYEYSLHDPFTIEDIPLYNKEKDAPIPYNEFLEYLRENKKEFLTFNENSKSKFYSTLESYGVIKKDWEQLIDINQYEGGVAYYFDDKNATTNHGLFSKMIIPAIEARLNEDGEENELITLFKNIASITKNLPELKKNSSAYAEIKSHNEEVGSSLSEHIQEKDKLDIHIEKGRSILTALSNEISSLEKEKNDHKSQLVELNKLKQKLYWQQSNLQYVIKHYELNDVNDTLQSNEEIQNEKEQQKETIKRNKEDATLQLQLKKWSVIEQQQKEIYRKINTIENSQEYSQSKEAQVQLEGKIEDEWKDVLKEIIRISTESEEYKNQILNLEGSLKQEIESFKIDLHNYQVKEGIIANSIKKFESEIEIQKEIYGEYFYYDMAQIYSQKKNELINNEKNHSLLINKRNEIELEKEELVRNDAALESEIKSDKKELNTLRQRWNELQEKEQTTLQKIWNVLHMTPFEVEDFCMWLNEQLPILRKKITDREIILDQFNIELYELVFEVKQDDKPFLVPNEEVYKVKSLLVEKGVPVLYGDEYIKQQEPEKREELNNKHPLLKYGLIVPNQNKVYITEISKLDKEYFHVPIPIFWVNQLNQSSEMQFVILDQKATELSIHDDKLLERKNTLSSKSAELKTEIETTKKYIGTLTKLVAELEAFDTRETAKELGKQHENLQLQLEQKIKNKIEIVKKLESIYKIINDLAVEIESSYETNKNLKSELKNLENWIENKKIYDSEKQQQYELLLKIQSANKKIDSKDNELRTLINDFKVWKDSYREWGKKVDELVEVVKDVLPKIFVGKVITEATKDIQPHFTMNINSLKDYLYKWKTIQQELTNSSSELAGLRARSEYIQQDVYKEEQKLSQLNSNWREYPIPQESISVLENRIEQIERSLNEINEDLIRLDSDINHGKSEKEKLEKEMEEMSNSIEEDYGEQPEIWESNDFSKMKIEIRQTIEKNNNDIRDTNEIINDLDNRVSQFNSIYQKLDATLNTLNKLNSKSGLFPSTYVQDLVKKEPVKTGDEWIESFRALQNNVVQKKRLYNYFIEKRKKFLKKVNGF